MVIELKKNNTIAKIQTKGAEIISFKGEDGKEKIWQADPLVWDRHSPVLFPVCCAVKNNIIIVDGKEYPMTKHGFVRDYEFEISNKGEDFADLVMKPDEFYKSKFPFDYELHVYFKLLDNAFSCRFIVENKSDRMMPFCIGGHPGFICPLDEESSFEDMEVVFECAENGVVSLLDSKGEIIKNVIFNELEGKDRFTLDRSYFEERDTLIFPELKSRLVKLISKKTGKGIKFSFSDMPVLAIWTKSGVKADYVCLEPWQGLPAGVDETSVLSDKPFAVKLEAGSKFECGYEAEII